MLSLGLLLFDWCEGGVSWRGPKRTRVHRGRTRELSRRPRAEGPSLSSELSKGLQVGRSGSYALCSFPAAVSGYWYLTGRDMELLLFGIDERGCLVYQYIAMSCAVPRPSKPYAVGGHA